MEDRKRFDSTFSIGSDDMDWKWDADEFLFNQITASKYDEYTVIKTNNYGKKQSWIFGIDGNFIYNSKKQNNSFSLKKLFKTEVKWEQRPLNSIVRFNWKSEKELEVLFEE